MTVRILTGDCRQVLGTLAEESVHCCITSPPYWGLRDYGIPPTVWGGDPACEHVWGDEIKTTMIGPSDSSTLGFPADGGPRRRSADGEARDKEARTFSAGGAFCQHCGAWRGAHGLEPTIDLYVKNAVEIFHAVHRVLRPDGTLWLNLGDSYATGTGKERKPTQCGKHGYWENPNIAHRINGAESNLKPKDLCGIPWRVAFALQADGWYLRQDIIWAKPNPMPESVTDRCTKAHEYLFLLTKSARYFYDAEAIKEAASENTHSMGYGTPPSFMVEGKQFQTRGGLLASMSKTYPERNKRSVWTVATSPFPEAHFATFPPELIEPCIKAGTSEKGCCGKCGAPWVRNTKATFVPQQDVNEDDGIRGAAAQKPMDASNGWQGVPRGTTNRETLGWSPPCQCGSWVGDKEWHSGPNVPCTVLDPFFGAGTTGLVADRLQRNCIGIELNPDYVAMAERRIRADAPLFAQTDDYDAQDDREKSVLEGFRAIRERMAAGGPPWTPKTPADLLGPEAAE